MALAAGARRGGGRRRLRAGRLRRSSRGARSWRAPPRPAAWAFPFPTDGGGSPRSRTFPGMRLLAADRAGPEIRGARLVAGQVDGSGPTLLPRTFLAPAARAARPRRRGRARRAPGLPLRGAGAGGAAQRSDGLRGAHDRGRGHRRLRVPAAVRGRVRAGLRAGGGHAPADRRQAASRSGRSEDYARRSARRFERLDSAVGRDDARSARAGHARRPGRRRGRARAPPTRRCDAAVAGARRPAERGRRTRGSRRRCERVGAGTRAPAGGRAAATARPTPRRAGRSQRGARWRAGSTPRALGYRLDSEPSARSAPSRAGSGSRHGCGPETPAAVAPQADSLLRGCWPSWSRWSRRS